MASADFVERGRQLCARAQYQEAVKVCRLGLLAHPTEVEGRLVLGEALLALSRHDEVLAEMRVALELDGDNPRALGLKGASLLRKGDVLQACDVLARAVTAAPGDPTLRQLYGEARNQRDAAMQAAERGGHWGHDAHVPGADTLRVGDRSETIEIDPDAEGVELINASSVGTPPRDRDSRDMLSEPSIELSSSDLLSSGGSLAGPYETGNVAPGYESMEGPFAPRPSARIPPLEAPVDRQLSSELSRLGRPAQQATFSPARQVEPHDDSGAATRQVPPGAGPADWMGGPGGYPGLHAGAPGRNGAAGPADPRGEPGRALHDPHGPGGRGDPRSREGDMRTIREGLGLPPEGAAAAQAAREAAPTWGGSPPGAFPAVGAGHAPDPRGPGMDMHGPGGMDMHGPGGMDMRGPGGMDMRGPGMDARGPAMDMRGPGMDMHGPGMDMRGPGPGPQPRGHNEIPRGRSRTRKPPKEPRQRQAPASGAPILSAPPRRGLPVWVYAVIGLVVVGGAVLAGLKVRDVRLTGQIEAEREAADRAVVGDVYPGYLVAMDAYARIVAADDDEEYLAAQAALAARMAVEVGDGIDEARRMVAALDQESDLPDAHEARGLLAVAEGDVDRAIAAATALKKIAPDDPDALYVIGRASLVAERAAEASAALRSALEKQARPSVAVALAQAEGEQGKFTEARAALDRALELRPQHAGAIIWGARIAVWSKTLPDGGGEPEAGLQAVMQEGGVPPAQQSHGVSPSQAAWAALALAEVRLARGDRAGALAGLGTAQASAAPGGFGFRAALIAMLVELNEVAAARAQVDLVLKQWPRAISTRVLEARVAIASGDPGAALAALEKAGDLARHADALALRGEARLASGAIDQAIADLDAALALRGGDSDIILTRAAADLARGDARTARKRVAPLYGDGKAASVDVVVAYAAALRQGGDRAAARKALAGLIEASGEAASDPRVLGEQARLARAEGQLEQAAELYRKAMAAAPLAAEPRLEAAQLAVDSGDPAAARAQLDEVLKPDTRSGRLLVDAARVHILTGDHKGAAELLDRAAAVTAPMARVARERGRLLLRRRQAEAAVAELEKAKGLHEEDGETRVLLMEAYLASKNRRAAAHELVELTKSFRGTSVLALARGFETLTRERWGDAASELARAHAAASSAGETPRVIGRAAYWAGRAYYLDGKSRQATEWLTRALSIDPSLADAHYLLGQIAFESQSGDRMRKSFERAVALDPSANPSAWFFLGEHYLSNEKPDKARTALQTYVDRWPQADFSTDARELLASIK